VTQDDDAPLTFQLIFNLPDYNAFKRHTVGGGRGQLDIDESTVEAYEAMTTYATRNKGAVFAAVVVVVKQAGAKPAAVPQVRGWKEPKRKRSD
jgi:hypothetical protein